MFHAEKPANDMEQGEKIGWLQDSQGAPVKSRLHGMYKNAKLVFTNASVATHIKTWKKMANRTYLLGLNEDFFEEENVSLHQLTEARYCIPILWLSLFQSNDIRLYETIPILLTSRESALHNIDRRFDGLVSFFGESCRKLITQWRDFIDKNVYANYLLNTMELAQMENAEGEFLQELKNYMMELDALVAGTHATRELSVVVQASESLVEYPYVDEPLHLCGYSDSVSLPWEQEQ